MSKIAQYRPIFLLIILAAFSKSYAYPEMIRHGYLSCVACHSSGSGGDLLNPYGKTISRELLSFSNNSQVVTSVDEADPEFRSGAHIRFLQAFVENSQTSSAQFFLMQLSGEFVWSPRPRLEFYTSLGRYDPQQNDATWKSFIYIPRIWASYKLINDESREIMILRVGRFTPAYGVGFSEHNFYSRSFLQLTPGREKMQAEIRYENDSYEAVLSKILGGYKFGMPLAEHGWLGRFGIIKESSSGNVDIKTGLNILQTSNLNSGELMNFAGIYFLLGANKKWAWLTQLDRESNGDGKTGITESTKISYELTQGLQTFGTVEYHNSDVEKTDPHDESYGMGLHYFPRPEMDFEGELIMEKNSSQLNEFQKALWLVAHFYI